MVSPCRERVFPTLVSVKPDRQGIWKTNRIMGWFEMPWLISREVAMSEEKEGLLPG